VFCDACGTARADDARFCAQCGKSFAADPTLPESPTLAVPARPNQKRAVARKGGVRDSIRVYLIASVLAFPFALALPYFSEGWLWHSSRQAGDLAAFAGTIFMVPFALYMRRTTGFLIFLALTLMASGSRYAQSWQELHAELRNASYAGCIKEPHEGVTDAWARFCACYADATLEEFGVRELAVLGRSMKSGTPDPNLQARVEPLAEKCAAQVKTP
jgi:hypothetical protein